MPRRNARFYLIHALASAPDLTFLKAVLACIRKKCKPFNKDNPKIWERIVAQEIRRQVKTALPEALHQRALPPDTAPSVRPPRKVKNTRTPTQAIS